MCTPDPAANDSVNAGGVHTRALHARRAARLEGPRVAQSLWAIAACSGGMGRARPCGARQRRCACAPGGGWRAWRVHARVRMRTALLACRPQKPCNRVWVITACSGGMHRAYNEHGNACGCGRVTENTRADAPFKVEWCL